jgi:hypothetical protein
MNEAEWQARRNRIDAKLRALTPPWQIVPYRATLPVCGVNPIGVLLDSKASKLWFCYQFVNPR